MRVLRVLQPIYKNLANGINDGNTSYNYMVPNQKIQIKNRYNYML